MVAVTSRLRLTLVAVLLVGAWLRLAVTFGDDGIFWPDEVYQSLEPAHRLVFGYGYIAWEFIEGARNWALPGLVAAVLKACATVGVDSPQTYLHAVKCVFSLLSVLSALGAWRLARALGGSELAGIVAALAFSLMGPAIYFAPRAMSENASAATAVWGMALLLDPRATRRVLAIGASLLGLAVMFRLQAGIFPAMVLLTFALRRQWGHLRDASVVLALWAVAFGALDAATWHDAPGAKWGGWFHSAVVYVRTNLLEGKASSFGVSPPWFYLKHLWRSMPLLSLSLLVGLVAATVMGVISKSPRVLAAVATALAFLVLHSAIPHKEYRFILPMLPVACGVAAMGLGALPGRLAVMGLWLVGVGSGLSVLSHRLITWGDLGAYPERAAQTAWDDFGPVNRLMFKAHTMADLCGIRIDTHAAWHGGFSHLHRRAPIHAAGTPPQSNLFNYAIVGAGSGGHVIAKDDMVELIKLPIECIPFEQQGYSWRLP